MCSSSDSRGSCCVLKGTDVWVAGSERQKVAEGEGERVKEAGSINRSLASLGLVIKKLVEGNRPGAPATQQPHIPYRDSRLTFLLQVMLLLSLLHVWCINRNHVVGGSADCLFMSFAVVVTTLLHSEVTSLKAFQFRKFYQTLLSLPPHLWLSDGK